MILDVSKYQQEINYNEVAKQVEGVILRCGITGWGDANECQVDPLFEKHFAGFKAAGVPVGAYYYSAADTLEKAREEAEFCKKILAGKQLELPVYYDLEEPHRMNKLTREQLTTQAEAWASIMEAAGYFVGIYANTSWFLSKLDHASLSKKYSLWLADYRENYNKTLKRDLHQYTSAGRINGITGGVDLSKIERPDLLTVVKESGLNGWEEPESSTGAGDPGPEGQPGVPLPQPGGSYTVKPGDSWWRIAEQQLGSGTRMNELAAANGCTTSDTIHPGQVIILPGGATQTPAQHTYVVKAGDSFWSIAATQMGSGSRMNELAAANGMTIHDTIHPGQTLVIPN